MAKINTPPPTTRGKARIIWVIIAFIILLILVGFGIWYLKKKGEETALAAAEIKAAPGITAIPGVGESSEEYIRLIKQENLRKAQEAERTQGAAVPTIVTHPKGGIATTLSEFIGEEAAPVAGGCDPKDLERARAAGVKVDELRCKGCNATEMRAAGFTAGALRNAGIGAKELRAAGFTASELKAAGLTASELKEAGVLANELKGAGFTAAELRAGGYDAGNLTAANFTPKEMREGGYSAIDLKAAGVNPPELKAAGYSASDLKGAGFNALDLTKAGYTIPELIAAGFSDAELMQHAGVNASQIRNLRAAHGQLGQVPKECNPVALQQANEQGVSAAAIKKAINCTAAAMKNSGFSATELKNGGYAANDLHTAGFTAPDLRTAGFTPADLKNAGFTAAELKNAGFTAGDLRRAGFTPADLMKAGYTVAELRRAGFPAEELRTAGVKAPEVKSAGYSAGELVRAAYTPEEIGAPELAAVTKATPPVTPPVTAPPTAPVTVPPITSTVVSPVTLPVVAPPPVVVTKPVVIVQQVPAPAPVKTTPENDVIAPMPPHEEKIVDMLERIQKKQERRMSGQQLQDYLKAIQNNMAAQANELFASWAPPATQQFVRAEKYPSSEEVIGGGGVVVGPDGRMQPSGGTTASGNIIKAGTVMFGVLDTGVNSDEQSPILATIVQGPLKGGKLLGQFNRVNKKVVLTFNVLSIPEAPNSLTINAVAIDPDTARTAIANSVDNHYMLRYGTLFASSFLAGLGEAILQSGSTTVNAPFGESTTQNPSTSAAEKGLIALGNVGNQYARVLGQNFQRPPTVKVNAGAGIGVLLMSDLSLPNTAPTGQGTLLSGNCVPTNSGRCP